MQDLVWVVLEILIGQKQPPMSILLELLLLARLLLERLLPVRLLPINQQQEVLEEQVSTLLIH
jgi:hypothetical protein